MLPNFLIIGAMKSGTTTLYHALKCHPDIFMAEVKEPQFFSDEKKIELSMSWYESLFKNATNQKAVGEASTNYSKYPLFKHVPESIKLHIPDAKLIYIIRNPIDRIYSQFTHNYYIGRVDNDLNRVITQNQNYINTSRYYMQLKRYLEVFDNSQIKVVLLEDLRDEPNKVIKGIYEYLGVESAFTPANMDEKKHQTINKAGRSRAVLNVLRRLSIYSSVSNRISENAKGRLNFLLRKKISPPGKMTDLDKEYLVEQLKDDVQSMQAYLGRDLSAWLREGTKQYQQSSGSVRSGLIRP